MGIAHYLAHWLMPSLLPHIMKYALLLCLSFLCAATSLNGQSEEDFEKFARDFYTLLSDSTEVPPLEYIRIKTWKQLIEEQDLDSLEKDEWIIRKNKAYAQEQAEFGLNLGSLIEEYQNALENGADFEWLSSSKQAHEKWKNCYHCYFRFVFQTEDLQTVVQLKYDVYYNGRGLVFIGTELEEEF